VNVSSSAGGGGVGVAGAIASGLAAGADSPAGAGAAGWCTSTAPGVRRAGRTSGGEQTQRKQQRQRSTVHSVTWGGPAV
jgi:hypothetical protein